MCKAERERKKREGGSEREGGREGDHLTPYNFSTLSDQAQLTDVYLEKYQNLISTGVTSTSVQTILTDLYDGSLGDNS